MTELYAPAPEEMKIGDVFRVVADQDHKGAFKLEKESSDQQQRMNLRNN